jgi:hypothetical protein
MRRATLYFLLLLSSSCADGCGESKLSDANSSAPFSSRVYDYSEGDVGWPLVAGLGWLLVKLSARDMGDRVQTVQSSETIDLGSLFFGSNSCGRNTSNQYKALPMVGTGTNNYRGG